MKIFFDTEFTGLHKNTTLISIGMIDENGRTFYAEFSDYDRSQCDNWIKENVIYNLKFIKSAQLEYFVNIHENSWEAYGDKEYIKLVLADWLSTYEDVQLVSDCSHYDMVLFIDIFGDAFCLPDNVNPVCHDINQDIAKHFNISEKEAFDLSREGIIKTYNEKIKEWWPEYEIKDIEGDKHNSLYDAKVIKEIDKILKETYQIK
jgi:hypothetical protein